MAARRSASSTLPATGKLFWGVVGAGAWRAVVVGWRRRRAPADARARPRPTAAIAVVASRSHRTPETDAYIRRYEVGEPGLGRLVA